jgi:uncharacterized protein YjdB
VRIRKTGLPDSLRIAVVIALIATIGCLNVIEPSIVHAVPVFVAGTSLRVGDSTQAVAAPITASGALIVGRHIAWESSNTESATVSPSGVVTAVGVGTVEIAAKTGGVSGRVTLLIIPP